MTYAMTRSSPTWMPSTCPSRASSTDLAGTQLTDLPTSLSTSVRTLATRGDGGGADPKYRKAVALQD